MEYTIPVNHDIKFTIKHTGSNHSGGNLYKLSGDFPPNVSLSLCSSIGGCHYTSVKGNLCARNTYYIFINNEPKYKLVPTVEFKLEEHTRSQDEKYWTSKIITDGFTVDKFDNFTVCLTLTSKFDDLKMNCYGTGTVHKYNVNGNQSYILPIEEQQYHIKGNDTNVEYFLFQTVTFKLEEISS